MFFILSFRVVWLLAAPCLACHVCAVVGAGLSRYCSALGKKFVYDYLFWRGRTPQKYDQWKSALLWMSVEIFSSLLAGLWHSRGCSVIQRGMSPVWSWDPVFCAHLCSGLLCDLGQATAPLLVSEFCHCKVKVLNWRIAEVPSSSKAFGSPWECA